MNIKSQEILNSIYEISHRRRMMLYNRYKFMLETKKRQLNYNEKMISNIGNDPSYNAISEKKLKEEKKVKKRVLMGKAALEKCKESGGCGDFMYDAIDPSKYIVRSRRNLEKVDESFQNCFSNYFKTPSQIKIQENRERIKKLKNSELPRVATRDSLITSINHLKKIDFKKKLKNGKFLKGLTTTKFGGLSIITSPRSFKISKEVGFWSQRKNNIRNYDSLKKFKSVSKKSRSPQNLSSKLKKKSLMQEEEKDSGIFNENFIETLNLNTKKRRGSFFGSPIKKISMRKRLNTFNIKEKEILDENE